MKLDFFYDGHPGSKCNILETKFIPFYQQFKNFYKSNIYAKKLVF